VLLVSGGQLQGLTQLRGVFVAVKAWLVGRNFEHDINQALCRCFGH
jgi:hypothetical protein